MHFMKLEPAGREELLSLLAGMPEWLSVTFRALGEEQARMRGADGALAPVEQVWHLADLETEGFGLRITRMRAEDEPLLPDFDGTAMALARDYRSLSLPAGMTAFRLARARNLAALRAVAAGEWTRAGTQEGVGRITLCDLPLFMAQHDAAHRAEIEHWRQQAPR